MVVCVVFALLLTLSDGEQLLTRSNLQGKPGKPYTLELDVGTPSQSLTVLIDTGSNNFAVAVAPLERLTQYFHINRSSSFLNLSTAIHVNNSVGQWSGTLGMEVISSPWIPGGPITVEMTAITESEQSFHKLQAEGVLGLAKEKPGGSVTPVFDQLVEERRVKDVFSMQLCGTVNNGTNRDTETGGTMVFDGMDHSLYRLPIVYTPLVNESYYSVVITGMTVGEKEVSLLCTEFNNDKTIVDSGTASLQLPVNVYNAVISLIKLHMNNSQLVNGRFWTGARPVCWPSGSPRFNSFPTISIALLSDEENKEFTLSVLPHMYLQASPQKATAQEDCYTFSIQPSTSGTVLGTIVMEGYYVVFDRINSRVGFATSTCQIEDPVFAKPSVGSPTTRQASTDCRHKQRLTVTQNLQGAPGQGYSMNLDIGTPPQQVLVLLDTGSSNFAVAVASVESRKEYFHADESSTYQDLYKTVSVDYTVGHWSGTLASEVISSPWIPGGPISVDMTGITESDKFFQHLPMHGILGLAYKAIAKPDGSVTPVFDYLVRAGRVSNVFSMQLCGTVDKGRKLDVSTGGTMVFNGTDRSLYRPPIVYTPLVKEWYYDVVITRMMVTRMMVGKNEVDLPCTEFNNDKSIVDSGTTSLRLPNKVYNSVLSLLRSYTTHRMAVNESFWNGGTIMCWSPLSPSFSNFPTLFISLLSDESEDKEFTLRVLPQMYLQAHPDPKKERDCYKFSILSSSSGTVMGAVVMEGYYVVFDRINSRVGFATSTCEVRDPGFEKPSVSSPERRPSSKYCRYKDDSSFPSIVLITLIVSGVVIFISAVIIAVITFLWCNKKKRRSRIYRELAQKVVNNDDE